MIQKLGLSQNEAEEILLELQEQDAPSSRFEARWIDTAQQLEALESAWRRLSQVATRPNLQMDPSFLMPAFRHLNEAGCKILVIEAPQIRNPDSKVLCGLLPLVRTRFYHLPLRCYKIWRHDQCLDATPLIRQDCAFRTLEFIFEFLRREGGQLLSMDTVSAEGPFTDVVQQVVESQNLGLFNRDQFSRAAFRPSASFDDYMANQVSKSVRKKVGRLERRLREQGDVQVAISDQSSDFPSLAQEFLDLESAGWKGEQGTALASHRSTREFFLEMVTRSAQDNRVSFLSLRLNNHPIAMLCDLYVGNRACAFKTAFDESFAQYSPGLLAEIKNIEHLHGASIVNMDSSTDPDNATINRIWKDRMAYQSMVIALYRGLPGLATSIMPLIQSTSRAVKKLRRD